MSYRYSNDLMDDIASFLILVAICFNICIVVFALHYNSEINNNMYKKVYESNNYSKIDKAMEDGKITHKEYDEIMKIDPDDFKEKIKNKIKKAESTN
jgi:hypothetical protein